MGNSTTAEFSMLLWLLGALVMALALHLSNGWVRRKQKSERLLQHWPPLLLAAASLGIGLCSALVLCMQAEALPFPVGYRFVAAAGLLAAAVVGCMPIVLMQARSQAGWVLFLSGALLALVATGLEIGWVWAAGFRPDVVWRREFVGGAVVLQLMGLAPVPWLAFAEAFQASERRLMWRLGALCLAALTVMGGQTVMLLAAGVVNLRGSVYQSEMPGTVLSLVFGVLVPLVLAALSLDLWMRIRQDRHRGRSEFNPKKRRKRRHRIRAL